MRALLSVYDKTELEPLARALLDLGFELVSTGGTMAALAAAGLPVTAVAAVTGAPEILDGRVKTLHPAIHGGLLARRDRPDDLLTLDAHGIVPIDLVAGNLYPFGATIAQPGIALTDALEQIDIGGPTMLRAAAKNFPDVIVLTDPADYAPVLAELRDGAVSPATRRRLAATAFGHVAAYDALIADFLGDEPFPAALTLAADRTQILRYGENPAQRAAAYRRRHATPTRPGVLDATQLAGKELSFNNLLDADAAWTAATAFAGPTVAIIKHAIPCGLARHDRLANAFAAALAGDPVSAFGGIVALTDVVDAETARLMAEIFFEVVIAPGFSPEARETLGRKQQLRLLAMPGRPDSAAPVALDVRAITGGFLVQDADTLPDDRASWRVVTDRAPSPAEWADLQFAWRAVRYVKSNGVVLAKDQALIGVGSGQPNRVVSVRLAVANAGDRAPGTVLASDAFFPFPDGIEAALAARVTALIQPGGSVRDAAGIAAADAAGAAMVFTGARHFRH